MIWLVLVIAAALVIWIVRAEILAYRVRALEIEVHEKLRPRVHDLANEMHRTVADVEILKDRK